MDELPRRLKRVVERRCGMEVEWRFVLGNKNYMVSNRGEVRNCKFDRPRKPQSANNGYVRVGIHQNGLMQPHSVHRLVLDAFVGPAPEGMECMHLNGVRSDNRLENLRWGTRKENHSHKKIHGTYQIGEKNPHVKWDEKTVLMVRSSPENSIRLSRRTGIPSATIRQIRLNKTWSHLPKYVKPPRKTGVKSHEITIPPAVP